MKLPEGWAWKTVSDLISHLDAGVSVNGEDESAQQNEFGVLKVSAVTEGVFRPKENKKIQPDELERARINPKAGKILMSRANSLDLIGASAYVDRDYPHLYLSDKLWQLEPVDNIDFDMKWLHLVLSSPAYRRKVSAMATGTSMSMKNISKDVVLSLPLLTPGHQEQKAIADTLSTWDAAIEKMERLIAAKEQRFLSLVDRLITMPIRTGTWDEVLVGSFLEESRIQGSTGDRAKKLTVKLYGKGAVPKSEVRQGSESTQYYVRRAGQFIYSKLDFLNGAFAIIPQELDGYESTLDLPAFDVSDKVSADWLLYFVSRPEFYQSQVELARGQRIARRINPSDFLSSTIPLPSLKEQRRIVDILDQAKSENQLTSRQLDLLRRQKRGLMQKLLTGAWRTKET